MSIDVRNLVRNDVSVHVDTIKLPTPRPLPLQKVELNQKRTNMLLVEDAAHQDAVRVLKAGTEYLRSSGADLHQAYMQTLKLKQIESERHQIQNLRDIGDGSAYAKASSQIMSKWQSIPDYREGGDNQAYFIALKNLDLRNFVRTVIAENKPHYDATLPAVGITKDVIVDRLYRYKAQRPAIDQSAPYHGWFTDKGYVDATLNTIKNK